MWITLGTVIKIQNLIKSLFYIKWPVLSNSHIKAGKVIGVDFIMYLTFIDLLL